MKDAIQSGLPPAPPPFLLDPGYAGTLDSNEFRHRFVSLVAMPRNIPAYGCYAVFFSVIFCLVPFGIFLYTRSTNFVIGCSSSAFFPWLLIVFFACVWGKGWRYERRMRRLGRQGVLVQGAIVSAQRVRHIIPGSDFSESDDGYTIIALEIKYRAETSDGQPIHGSGVFRRDDLLNAELPGPGAPVWILVLDQNTHAIL